MKLMRLLIVLMVSSGIIFIGTPNLYADDTSEIILKLLIKKGIITQEEVDKLKAEIAKEKPEVPEALEERVTKLEEEAKKPLFVKIGEGDMRLKGYIQSRYTYFEKGSGNDSFRLKSAYLAVKGHVVPDILYELEVDAAASTNILRNAYIRFEQLPYANLTIGQFKIPFSQEYLDSSSIIDTIERARVVTNLTEERDIGAMVSGGLASDRISYGLGIFNGNGINTTDNNDNKDVVGRVVLAPFKDKETKLSGLKFGGAFMAGKQPESGTNRGDRYRYGALLKYEYDRFKLQSEYIYQEFEQTTGSDKTSDGWYALAAYKFIPQLQGVLKFEQYDPDRDVARDREDITTVGLNWFINKYTKLMVNYRFKDEQTEVDDDEAIAQLQVKF